MSVVPDQGRLPPRVLVVDDDAAIRHVVGELLVDEGYAVREASNGEEALAQLAEWVPDVIVLDLMMPVMNGWSFRREPFDRSIAVAVPVVVLSASRRAEATAAEPRAVAIMTKPFDAGALVATVEHAQPDRSAA
jgi:CheY-like chemotaxis protein